MAKVKRLNIDEFLTEQGVEITIKGKQYLIQDIPVEVQAELTKTPPDYKKIVLTLIGVKDQKVLDGYGIVALSKIVSVVHENLLLGVSRETPLKD